LRYRHQVYNTATCPEAAIGRWQRFHLPPVADVFQKTAALPIVPARRSLHEKPSQVAL
jgi:hypothetical protein